MLETLNVFKKELVMPDCGIVGVCGRPEAAKLVYLGLQMLQHRGQEGSGIAASDGTHIISEVGIGKVNDFFTAERLARLQGTLAIGHNRYSTAGAKGDIRNAQPFVFNYALGTAALAHNGNLVNAPTLREGLENEGALFRSSSDTEVLLHLIARARKDDLLEGLMHALPQAVGAYSLVVMNERELIVARDPLGFRPLSVGAFEDGGYIVASETCAFDLVGALHIGDVAPGYLVRFTSGVRVREPEEHRIPGCSATVFRPCIFELIYFSRPDSEVFGLVPYFFRKALGRELAREAPVAADMVLPVPDSGMISGLGFSEESGIPLELGLIRSHYAERTFIEPEQAIRNFGVKLKLNSVRRLIRDKRVVVVDDSIVRGTTTKKIVAMLHDARAREVHVRSSSPPIMHPCLYGMDFPTHSELVAHSRTAREVRDFIRADSLVYLSHAGMYRALRACGGEGGVPKTFCDACFTGAYPTSLS